MGGRLYPGDIARRHLHGRCGARVNHHDHGRRVVLVCIEAKGHPEDAHRFVDAGDVERATAAPEKAARVASLMRPPENDT